MRKFKLLICMLLLSLVSAAVGAVSVVLLSEYIYQNYERPPEKVHINDLEIPESTEI